MKNSSLFKISIFLMVFYIGLIGQTTAQGIRNEGATVNVASGCYVFCQGGFNNSIGAVTNDGILTVTGEITNPVSATIEGDGSYNIGGNLINNGTFTQTAGTTTFNGTGAQTISGSSVTTFNNLVIDDASDITTIAAGAMVTVSGSTFDTNDKLIINSDALNNNGSLIYNGTGTPSGNITYNRQMRTEANAGDRHFFASPASGQSILGFTTVNGSKINPLGPDFEIWKWNELDGRWDIVPSTDIFASGKGYNIDQTTVSDGLLKFTGTVVNSATFTATSPYINGYTARSSLYEYGGDGNTNSIWSSTPARSWLNYGGGGWNLLGNPFTSAMDAAAFLTSNTPPVSAINKFDPNYQALYVYDGVNSVYKYAAVELPGPVRKEGGFFGENIQAGQGFFVLAIYDGVIYNFNQNMQVHNTAVTMLKSAEVAEPWPGLELKVKYGNRESLTTIVYNDEMTTGLDPGYDVGQFSAGPDVEIYTTLVLKDNSVNFVRQALPLTDYDKNIIPVGIDSEKGGEVTFSAFTVPLESYKFWLEDRTAGTFTNLNSNTYTVTLPANTYGTGRFFIIASTNTPTGIRKPEAVDTDLRIWTSDDKVIIKGAVSEGALCEIYDLRGLKILEKKLADGELNTVTLPSGLHGVYLVRVIDGAKITTRKVAIS